MQTIPEVVWGTVLTAVSWIGKDKWVFWRVQFVHLIFQFTNFITEYYDFNKLQVNKLRNSGCCGCPLTDY